MILAAIYNMFSINRFKCLSRKENILGTSRPYIDPWFMVTNWADNNWAAFSTLDFISPAMLHYRTQPLPTPLCSSQHAFMDYFPSKITLLTEPQEFCPRSVFRKIALGSCSYMGLPTSIWTELPAAAPAKLLQAWWYQYRGYKKQG